VRRENTTAQRRWPVGRGPSGPSNPTLSANISLRRSCLELYPGPVFAPCLFYISPSFTQDRRVLDIRAMPGRGGLEQPLIWTGCAWTVDRDFCHPVHAALNPCLSRSKCAGIAHPGNGPGSAWTIWGAFYTRIVKIATLITDCSSRQGLTNNCHIIDLNYIKFGIVGLGREVRTTDPRPVLRP